MWDLEILIGSICDRMSIHVRLLLVASVRVPRYSWKRWLWVMISIIETKYINHVNVIHLFSFSSCHHDCKHSTPSWYTVRYMIFFFCHLYFITILPPTNNKCHSKITTKYIHDWKKHMILKCSVHKNVIVKSVKKVAYKHLQETQTLYVIDSDNINQHNRQVFLIALRHR